MCVAEPLCCPPETTETLLIGYTPVQDKKFKKIGKPESHINGIMGYVNPLSVALPYPSALEFHPLYYRNH